MNHIAIIFGGPSAEHDVSLVSARNIFEVLEESQVRISLLGIDKEGGWNLVKPDDLKSTSFKTPLDIAQKGLPVEWHKEDNNLFIELASGDSDRLGPIEVAFPIIHGPYGENGQLQKELNDLGLAFVGCDTMSCENAFDKAKTKEIISSTGVQQAPYLVFTEQNPDFAEVSEKLGVPFFVKPANMGSSIGISKVNDENEMLKAVAEARIHDKKIVIEQAVVGREIEVALLEREQLETSTLGEIKPHHDFYSYEAKYIDENGAELIIPAVVDDNTRVAIQNAAKVCFQALECRDYARADFFLKDDGSFFFNEINTHPGFTNISQFPMLWQESGVSYRDLILHLLKQASSR